MRPLETWWKIQGDPLNRRQHLVHSRDGASTQRVVVDEVLYPWVGKLSDCTFSRVGVYSGSFCAACAASVT